MCIYVYKSVLYTINNYYQQISEYLIFHLLFFSVSIVTLEEVSHPSRCVCVCKVGQVMMKTL